jgi:hypothetical protein
MNRMTMLVGVLTLGMLGLPSAVSWARAPTPFDGTYRGSMTQGVTGQSSDRPTPICETTRPMNMTISYGNVFVVYLDWHKHTLHYRGTVDASGKIDAQHTNRDGSAALLTGQIANNQFTGHMNRGRCDYEVAMAKQ